MHNYSDDERDLLQKENAYLKERLNEFDCCMCGSPMDNHDIGSGHSPVSMYDYRLDQVEKERDQFADAAAKNALEIGRLLALLQHAQAALKVFAKIRPSSLYAEDGSEDEQYCVMLKDKWTGNPTEFTGKDLAMARAVRTLIEKEWP